MFCKNCRYHLASLSSGPCPECGRPFDPSDPATYALHSAPRVRRSALARIQLLLALWPVLWLVFPYTAALVGRIQLGRWPVWPDDHAKWTAAAGWLFGLGNNACISFPFAALAALGILVVLIVPTRRERQWPWWWRRALLTLACWGGWWILIKTDPGHILFSFNWDLFD